MSFLQGIDISKWQKEMDWAQAEAGGAKYAFIRAGSISIYGVPYTDYQFDTNARIAPSFLPVGFYWYFRPQFDPAAQAEYFCNLIKDKPWKLPPVLDLETTGGETKEEVTLASKIFATEIYTRLNIWPLLYSRGLWLNAYTVTDDALWDFMDLWCARYKTPMDGPWGDGYCKPDNFDEWKFWQYTSSGNGALYGAQSRSIDMNYFNGDQAAFEEYIGDAPPPVYTFPPSIGVKVDIEGLKYKGHIEKVE